MIKHIKEKISRWLIKTIEKTYISDVVISKELIHKYLPPNPIIIDCGAHVGIDSLELAEIPGSLIYSFEAVDDIFKKLKENTKERKNITSYNLALSSYDGEADFYVSSGGSDGSSSLLKPKEHLKDHPEVSFNEVVKVKCLTLDTWAADNNVLKVDMLWLDMQGYEQQMLAASEKILDTVSVIHTEVSVRETYEGVNRYEDFRKFLEEKGFQVIAEAIPEGYDMGNVLFIRQNFLNENI